MDALTASQIERLIEAQFEKESDSGASEITSWYGIKYELGRHVPWQVEGLEYPVYFHEDHGGGEGSGEEMWIILESGGRYFRKDGFYASFDGDNWDGAFVEVQRRQEVVTVFREVK